MMPLARKTDALAVRAMTAWFCLAGAGGLAGAMIVDILDNHGGTVDAAAVFIGLGLLLMGVYAVALIRLPPGVPGTRPIVAAGLLAGAAAICLMGMTP